MKNPILFSSYTILVFGLSVFGCSTSEKTTSNTETNPTTSEIKKAPEQPVVKEEPPVTKKADTVNVEIQYQKKPVYEPPPSQPQTSTPSGKFSVQIGAYKMPDNADRIASLAKERFNMNVYTSVDKTDNLYKVMIGDFNSKDEARNFRDQMAAKFPSDYKDAWVSENPQK